MPRPRTPWWIPGVAASVLGYLILLLYADVGGPGALGVDLRFSRAGAEVAAVLDGYPGAAAGLKPGDVIVELEHKPVPGAFEWALATSGVEVGRPAILRVRREGTPIDVPVSFPAHWRRWTSGLWLAFAAKALAKFATLGLAFLIGFRRPRDPVALVAASWLLSLSITDFSPVTVLDPPSPTPPPGTMAIWRLLPWPLHVPLWVGAVVFLLGPFLTALLFALFPRQLYRTRRAWAVWWLAWSPALLVLMPVMAIELARQVYRTPGDPGAGFPWLSAGLVGFAVMTAVGVGLAQLVLNYRRLDDRNERRRVRVVVGGVLLGLIGTAVPAMVGHFPPSVVQRYLQSPAVRASSSLVFLLLPLSLTYAILRYRLFDIGFIVRQGLQYALARRVLATIVPACVAVLAVDVMVHGDQPLWDVVRARGWVYGGIAALAFTAHVRQKRWLDALDRRFFRERYDAQLLLRDVVEQVQVAASVEQVAPAVVSRIEAALHPEFAALLARDPREATYRVLASAPSADVALSLRADSKLLGLLRLLGRPLDTGVGESGWLKDQLPHEDTAFLRDTRVGLLAPVSTQPGSREALLALGVKRSEEPYSRDDQDLMIAVATSLSLLLDRSVPSPSTEAFEECPACGLCSEAGATACPDDGTTLVTVHLPRAPADRYRLERRLGRGGMGTVYEATDLSLRRPVAVKVIREDLVGSRETVERFRHEALAAAAFAHPNVVTVHDFGVAAGTRGFLVMELLRGMTIRDVLRRERRLGPARTMAILRDVCAAVDAAHQRQLVHRDLKPENVFLVRDGTIERAKVLDFGIAKFTVDEEQTMAATGTGQLLGTLHYMGPEQLRGGAVHPGWDLWALGVMAYEMLTGSLPFTAATPVDYQSAVLAGRFTPPQTLLPEASPRLPGFFARALALDAAGRPASASAFADELERALS